jgi:hypothetical protein
VDTPSYLIVVSSERTDTEYTLLPSQDQLHLPSQHSTFVEGGDTLIIRIISFQRDSQQLFPKNVDFIQKQDDTCPCEPR